MKYDYGDPDRGFSYEWNHFYLGLKPSFKEVRFFDYMGELSSRGRDGMHRALQEEVSSYCPDVTIFSLYTDQFSPKVIQQIRQCSKTLCFFHDDGWRKQFVSYWAPHFDAFTTSDPNGLIKYEKRGWKNVVHLPFGVNDALFKPITNVVKDIDVSFVGGWHPYRQWLVSKLRKEGVKVQAYGYGWPTGMVSTEEMIQVFQRSKISLNFSNCSSWDVRYIFSSFKSLKDRLRSKKVWEQIKGRHFEIPACGCMQLSYYVEGLEHLFDIGKEIAIYTTPEELLEKCRFYLEHESEREAVAEAGLTRVMCEHRYADRFTKVFSDLGWM